MLVKALTRDEVEQSVKSSKLHTAPGNESITSLLCKECLHILEDALTDVAKSAFEGHQTTRNQRTCLMLYTDKPGKSQFTKPKDKRRLSLLNLHF